MKNSISDWLHENSKVFWGEIAPCEKRLQDYDQDHAFLSALSQYVEDGLLHGERVILLASANHLKAVSKFLNENGHDVGAMVAQRHLVLSDVAGTIKHFVVNGWPNDILFVEHFGKMVERYNAESCSKTRIISELVAKMWESSSSGATLHLENLCKQFARAESWQMVCAYPSTGFTQSAALSMQYILKTHSRMRNDFENPYLSIA